MRDFIHIRQSNFADTMTSPNENIFPRYWPFARDDRWTKASDPQLWYFLWFTIGQTVDQTTKTPVIWDAIELIMMTL